MKFLKTIFNKFKKDNRGVTGTDVAAAIIIIALTMGVVTSIYINTINKYKDNVRYSNATRIATSIMEQIESNTFVDVVNACQTIQDDGTTVSEKTVTNNESILGVKVQAGYTATVSATKVATAETVDIARDIKVEVFYNSTLQTKSVTLYGVKELEILNQVNSPDISMLSDYSKYLSGEVAYYPIVANSSGTYTVTDYNDSNWYDYMSTSKTFALIGVVSTTDEALNIGDEFKSTSGLIYEWIPRFGLDDSGKVKFCYGTSKHAIGWSAYESGGKTVYGYMIARNASDKKITDIKSWFNDAFTDEDGLTGIWNIKDNRDGTAGLVAQKIIDS
jgi:hypothetical protein